MYLYALEPPPPRPVADGAAVARGATLFDAHCKLCHANAILGGDPMPVDQVGTEPSLANGKARGTGKYRVAPLARVLVPLKGLTTDRFFDRRLKRMLKLPDNI